MTAPPQPAAPAPQSAGVGERERVSVDAWALDDLVSFAQTSVGHLPDSGAAYVRGLVTKLTARPLPVGGAVDARTIATWRTLADAYDSIEHGGIAACLRQACTALESTPQPAPVAVDRAAVEDELDRLIQNARDLGADEADGHGVEVVTQDVADARDALLALVFPDAPAADAPSDVCAHEPYDPPVPGVASTCRLCGAIYVATTPALVNGGPPRDSLDDGR